MSDSASGYVPGQTALLVEIPEAQPAVGAWRARFDTSAAVGVGPHVTVLFPFLALPSITAAERADLATVVAAEPAFTVTFGGFGTFPAAGPRPAVLHLVPTPGGPFRRLTAAIAARWRQCPPYAGEVDDPIPHLTVTGTAPPDQVEAARRAIEPRLPITAAVGAVRMIAFDGVAWHPGAWYPMNHGAASALDHSGAGEHQRTPGRRRSPAMPRVDSDDAPAADQ